MKVTREVYEIKGEDLASSIKHENEEGSILIYIRNLHTISKEIEEIHKDNLLFLIISHDENAVYIMATYNPEGFFLPPPIYQINYSDICSCKIEFVRLGG